MVGLRSDRVLRSVSIGHHSKVTAAEWIEHYAKAIGEDRPSRAQMKGVLDLAATAAHASERKAAPIACWLAGRTGRPLSELQQLAASIEREEVETE
jgi:Domain of unknown function (DUF6457)